MPRPAANPSTPTSASPDPRPGRLPAAALAAAAHHDTYDHDVGGGAFNNGQSNDDIIVCPDVMGS